jgi:hypothetical protein
MNIKLPVLLLHFCFVITSFAQAPDRQQFVHVGAPMVVLMHLRGIDGTGAAPLEDVPPCRKSLPHHSIPN